MDITELSSSLRSVIATLHKGLRKQMYSFISYSMTEIETIALLYRNPKMLPTELAALTNVKTQSMSQILNKLVEQGIATRTPSKEDKRKVYVSITGAGKKIIEKTRYERDEKLKAMIERSLSKKEIEQLGKLIPILNKLTEIK